MPHGFKLLDSPDWPCVERPWEVVQVEFGHKTNWRLHVDMVQGEHKAQFDCGRVVSFRVEDEADILDYWVSRSNENISIGTLYSIDSSEFLEEISHGINGLTRRLTHFLIAGQNTCVEVIAETAPIFSVDSAI